MKSFLRHPLTLGLILTIGFAQLGHTAWADPAQSRLTITLRVHNYAGVTEKILSEAEQEVSRIFSKIAVETVWLNGRLPRGERTASEMPDNSSPASGSFTASNLQLRIYILSRSVATRADSNDVMGLTPGHNGKRARMAYVFYHRVEDLAQRVKGKSARLDDRAQILGHAIAHEIGHILLPFTYTHSARGIMRATWDLNDIRRAAWGETYFTTEQAELVRAGVLNQFQEQQALQAAALELPEMGHAKSEPAGQLDSL